MYIPESIIQKKKRKSEDQWPVYWFQKPTELEYMKWQWVENNEL